MRIETFDLNNHINTLHEEDAALSWVADQKINPKELSESSLLKLLTEAIRFKSISNIELIVQLLLNETTSDNCLLEVGKLLSNHPLLYITRYGVKAMSIILKRETTEGYAIIALQILAEIYARSDPIAELKTIGDILNFNFEVEKNCARVVEIVDRASARDQAVAMANGLTNSEAKLVLLKMLNKSKKVSRTNRIPAPAELQMTIKEAIKKFVLSETELKIRKSDKIVTGGSCFARTLGYCLQKEGYDVYRFILAEELNTTFANKLMLKWLNGGWIDDRNASKLEQLFLNSNLSKADIKTQFQNADHIVLTLGTTQCFFDHDDQFQITPPGFRDLRGFLKTHYPRMTSVSDNENEINEQIELINSLNSKATIFYTLSPVPLNVSFCGGKAINQDCLSKSTLRIAIENVIQKRKGDNVRYFPSFEIVRWLAPMYTKPFGQDDGSMRHVSDQLVNNIITSFLEQHA